MLSFWRRQAPPFFLTPKSNWIVRRLDLGNDVGDVGLVERREREALLTEMVQGRANMNQRRAVDYQEAVMELVGHLDR